MPETSWNDGFMINIWYPHAIIREFWASHAKETALVCHNSRKQQTLQASLTLEAPTRAGTPTYVQLDTFFETIALWKVLATTTAKPQHKADPVNSVRRDENTKWYCTVLLNQLEYLQHCKFLRDI